MQVWFQNVWNEYTTMIILFLQLFSPKNISILDKIILKFLAKYLKMWNLCCCNGVFSIFSKLNVTEEAFSGPTALGSSWLMTNYYYSCCCWNSHIYLFIAAYRDNKNPCENMSAFNITYLAHLTIFEGLCTSTTKSYFQTYGKIFWSNLF